MLVMADPGLSEALQILLEEWNAAPLVLHLFKNDYTPVPGVTLSNLTEADFDGYAPVSLKTWSAPAVAGNVASSQPLQEQFTKAAGLTGNNIYGIFVTDGTGTRLMWAERDPSAPVAMSVTGRLYIVQAQFTTRTWLGS